MTENTNKKEHNMLLDVHGLKKYFPVMGGVMRKVVGYVKAVDDVNFFVREGETLGLVGESGCGKTTAGRAVLRIYEPTDGDIKFKSRALSTTGKPEWVNIRELRLAGSEVPLDAFWPEEDVWQVDLPLGNEANDIAIEAYDFRGNLIDSKSITVTTTKTNPAINALRVTEVNYNPGDPTPAEVGLGHDDADDFEFIELRNTSSETISLAGVELAQVQVDGESEGVAFDFSSGAINELNAGEFILVVEDAAAFAARYGDNLPVAGQWSGGLSNNSETITVRAEGAAIQQFAYDDNWYPTTDGGGFSLEIRNEAADLEAWGMKSGWLASGLPDGSPGTNSLRPGDSNHDGVFNSSDFVLVFQAGEYEDGIAGNSTFEEGDWDGDGDFTTSDFVHVFRLATYSNEARPAELRPADLRPAELAMAAVEADHTIRSIDGVFDDFGDDEDDELDLGFII